MVLAWLGSLLYLPPSSIAFHALNTLCVFMPSMVPVAPKDLPKFTRVPYRLGLESAQIVSTSYPRPMLFLYAILGTLH
jgi:hypothetical protein